MHLKKYIRYVLFCLLTCILAAGAGTPAVRMQAQNGIYDWLGATPYSPEYDFTNSDLSGYAKDDLLSLKNKGFFVFDGNTLSVRKNASASIGGAHYLGDYYGLAGGVLSFDALTEKDGRIEAGVRCISPNADPYEKGIFFILTDNKISVSIPTIDFTKELCSGIDMAADQRIEIRDTVDEITLFIEGRCRASILYGANGALSIRDGAGSLLAETEETFLYPAGYWNIKLERTENAVWIDHLKFDFTEIDQTLPERDQRHVSYQNWVATDDLGRTTSMGSQTGGPKEDKYVGIFYFLCVVGAGVHVQDNTKIYLESGADGLKQYLQQKGGEAYWSEPYFGYYRNTDTWVYRKHAYMLEAAGVDFVFLDISNEETFDKAHLALFDTWLQIRKEGGQTPQICFLTGDTEGRLESHMKRLLKTVYSDKNYSKYEELFFKWEGKPLIFGNSANLSDEMKNTLNNFTVRGCWAWENRDGYWNWLQEIRYDENSGEYFMYKGRDPFGNFEQLAVAMGHHPSTSKGRSYVKGVQPNNGKNDFEFSSETSGLGLGFASQFEMAIELDPQVIMITGWNEWIAGLPRDSSFTHFANTDVNGYMYIDQFNPEFSRDGEPMKLRDGVGFGDNYYYQMVDYIRKFKGMEAEALAAGQDTIDLYGDVSQWENVSPEFRDTIGDVAFRNEPSYDMEFRYINNTGRNDFEYAKISQDDDALYFFVKTVHDIVRDDGADWMNLYIDLDKNHETGWEGYDYVINRKRGETHMSIEKFNGNTWEGSETGEAEYTLGTDYLILKVEKKLLGVESGGRINFDFKWSDHSAAGGNIMEFMDLGDTAPNDRFNFRYLVEGGKDLGSGGGLSTAAIIGLIAGGAAIVLAAAVVLIFKIVGKKG
ncbi:MAG: hypothetical protein ACLSVG_01080 [Clostridia bacterium]